jgi:hypothetical protein
MKISRSRAYTQMIVHGMDKHFDDVSKEHIHKNLRNEKFDGPLRIVFVEEGLGSLSDFVAMASLEVAFDEYVIIRRPNPGQALFSDHNWFYLEVYTKPESNLACSMFVVGSSDLIQSDLLPKGLQNCYCIKVA